MFGGGKTALEPGGCDFGWGGGGTRTGVTDYVTDPL